MNASDGTTADRAKWQSYFAEIIISGDDGEIQAATEAAMAAAELGDAAARAAGKAAARDYRNRAAGAGGSSRQRTTPSATPPWSAGSSTRVRVDPQTTQWPDELAARLFATPARWGWQAAEPPAPVTGSADPVPTRPAWIESPRPDTSALRRARSKAVSELIGRLAFTVLAVFAFATFQVTIEEYVSELGESAGEIYQVALIVAGAVLLIEIFRAIGAVRHAARNIRDFEQPYLTLRAAEKERHRQALKEWEEAVRRHQEEAAEARRAATRHAAGPLWYPVHPASEPTRVDVFGGDPRRHGWASLLVTMGCSALAAGHRITLLDLTGLDVGGGLLRVSRAGGMSTRHLTLTDGDPVDFLTDLPSRAVPECLGYALIGRTENTDLRQERALVTDVLRRVVECLDGRITFARLAAGVQVLRRGSAEERSLTTTELNRLVSYVGELDQNEWTARQLQFLANQLGVLAAFGPGKAGSVPLWTADAVSAITTGGGRDDRKALVDRLLVQLAQQAMEQGRCGSLLVVAGADHLGAETLKVLSEHARHAGVRLVLMIDQPQGELEKTAGTGGTVCIMKMYNHRDANIAAEFIGKGHRFVVNQVTRQVGKTFTDGGGDSFAANTGSGSSTQQRRSGTRGRDTSLSDSRGHTWTGVRNWSTADNLSTSTGSGRVYEFIVEPQEILGMPETSFILVDNSGQGRRVVMADGNPGICLLDRVATIPAQGGW